MTGSPRRTAYQEFHDVRIEPTEDGVVVGRVSYDRKRTNPFGVINGDVAT